MGTFKTACKIENPSHRDRSAVVKNVLVDSGSEYTWVATPILERLGIAREKKDLVFTMANASTITRSVGFAIIRLEKHFTIDEVVFAEPGDLAILGARTLEGMSLSGMSLSKDPRRKKRVASGPIPAASTSRA